MEWIDLLGNEWAGPWENFPIVFLDTVFLRSMFFLCLFVCFSIFLSISNTTRAGYGCVPCGKDSSPIDRKSTRNRAFERWMLTDRWYINQSIIYLSQTQATSCSLLWHVNTVIHQSIIWSQIHATSVTCDTMTRHCSRAQGINIKMPYSH